MELILKNLEGDLLQINEQRLVKLRSWDLKVHLTIMLLILKGEREEAVPVTQRSASFQWPSAIIGGLNLVSIQTILR